MSPRWLSTNAFLISISPSIGPPVSRTFRLLGYNGGPLVDDETQTSVAAAATRPDSRSGARQSMTWSVWPRGSHHLRGQTMASLTWPGQRANHGMALLLAVAMASAGLGWGPAARAAACEIPRTAAGSLPAAPAATPTTRSAVIQVAGSEATPASLPAASPEATPIAPPPTPEPAADLTDELIALSDAVATCLSEGDAKTVTQLADGRYLGQLFGSSVPLSPEDYTAIASALTPVPTRIVAVEDITQSAGDRATATVTQVVGNQLMRDEWTFERVAPGERPAGRSTWKLRSERSLPIDVPRDAKPIDVKISDTAYTLDVTNVSGPDVVLHGDNVGTEDHELLVLKLENGFTTAELLRATGPDLPKEAIFIGEIPIRSGHEADLALIDLDPGVYTIVCLFPNADGVPYLAAGMEAAFTVK
jgi:hypothetical protein